MGFNNDLPITPPMNDRNSMIDTKFLEDLMNFPTMFPVTEYDTFMNQEMFIDMNQFGMHNSLGLNINEQSNFGPSFVTEEDMYIINNATNMQLDQYSHLQTPCDSYNTTANNTPLISLDNNLINNSPIMMTQSINTYNSSSEPKEKPAYSYSQLITKAIMESNNKQLLLSEIYDWMINQFQYFKNDKIGVWKNSVRHNLSVNKCFKRAPRQHDQPGKGSYWTIDFDQLSQLDKRSHRRRFNPIKNNP